MIPPKTHLPTITPPGRFDELVRLAVDTAGLDDTAAAGLVHRFLDRLGLYGPLPEADPHRCRARFFDADPDELGWAQCGEDPDHADQDDALYGEALHMSRTGRCWRDSHRQALPADR